MTGPIFVDTNIWVYALTDSTDPRHAWSRRWLESLVGTPCINGQVLREVGRTLLIKARLGESGVRAAMDHLFTVCRSLPDNRIVFLNASRLRETHAFSYWDSLIVAAALEGDCATLASEDMQHGQAIEGVLTILNPFVEA
ncbi:MAG: PIN domain-containing protein [Magnetococcales bacterium]|nr:PIN domain-containing protein [Magnetococcales bacterium]